jgi:hypothetical protein
VLGTATCFGLVPTGPGDAATNRRTAAAYPPAALLVEARGGNFSFESRELDVTVDMNGETQPAGRITIDAPAHFPLDPSRSPGYPVGQAYVFARTPTGGLAEYAGPIAAEPVDPAGETQAQTCSPGTHLAIWLIHLQQGPHKLDLPVYLAAPTGADPAGTGLVLSLCPSAASVVAGAPADRLTIAAVVLVLSGLDTPKTPGLYTWRALIAPRSADDRPLPNKAYELRALVAVPHVLTLRGSYNPTNHRAVLTGALRLRGQPQSSAFVALTRLDRTITPHGPAFHDAPAAIGETSRTGTYRLTVALRRTVGFVATTPPTLTPCRPPAAAPTGCKSSTRSGAESEPITVSVP